MAKPEMTDNDIAAVVAAAVLGEREACAAIIEKAARALISGRRRISQMDGHVSDVLMRKATEIRARGER